MIFLAPTKIRFVTALTTATCVLSMGIIPSAMAKSSRQYDNLNQKQFNECMKPPSSNGSEQGWAQYNGENSGTVELKVRNQPMIKDGTVAALLTYQFEPSQNVLTMKIEEKTKFFFGLGEASDDQIWDGFDGLVEKCRNSG